MDKTIDPEDKTIDAKDVYTWMSFSRYIKWREIAFAESILQASATWDAIEALSNDSEKRIRKHTKKSGRVDYVVEIPELWIHVKSEKIKMAPVDLFKFQ